MDWNDDSRAKLRRLWEEGLTTTAIGEALGVTKNAIVGQLHRLRRKLGRREIEQRHNAKGHGKKLARLPPPRPAQRNRNKVVAKKPPDRRMKVTARIEPPPLPPPPRKTPVTLLEADTLACRWIEGQAQGPDTLFCGHRKLDGVSYCSEHTARVFSAKHKEVAGG